MYSDVRALSESTQPAFSFFVQCTCDVGADMGVPCRQVLLRAQLSSPLAFQAPSCFTALQGEHRNSFRSVTKGNMKVPVSAICVSELPFVSLELGCLSEARRHLSCSPAWRTLQARSEERDSAQLPYFCNKESWFEFWREIYLKKK